MTNPGGTVKTSAQPTASPSVPPNPRPTAASGRTRPAWLSAIGPTRLSAVYLWLLFIVLFSILIPGTFLSGTTFRLVFSEGVVTCVLALAFLVPLAAGGYDLSIGAVMSTSLAICVYLNIHSGIPPGIVAVIAMLRSALVGFVNGFIVVRLRVNSFIATLGTSQVLFAVVLLISNNAQLVAAVPQFHGTSGQQGSPASPALTSTSSAIALVIWYVLEHTPVGRYLFATGGNEEAARLSGVRTDRTIWGAFVASGASRGLAGVIYSMRTGLTRQASARATCSPRSPRSSSVHRSSRSDRTCGARSSRTSRSRSASRGSRCRQAARRFGASPCSRAYR